MSLLINYNFSSSSYRAPNKVRNVATASTAYFYDAILADSPNNPSINQPGVTSQSASALFNSAQSQYIKVPSLNITNAGLTFSFSIKSNNNSNYTAIFDFGNGGPGDNIYACIHSGKILVGVALGANSSLKYFGSDTNINDNTWTHITWSLSNPTGWKVYLNGVLSGSYPTGYYPNILFRNLNYLGKSNYANDRYFNGNIADFRMYNSVLSASDVLTLYNNSKILSSTSSGNALINTGFNELYNQIFCDLFTTNNGFNQCTDCNYGDQELYNTSTQSGEQNCLNACNAEPRCTSYSYDTSVSENNCKQYNTFPSQIYNGVENINSGYSLKKYTYNYSDLSPSQKLNSQEKCIAQYIDNYFTPGKKIDIPLRTTRSLNQNTGNYYTNIIADPHEIFDLYTANGLISPPVYTFAYNNNNNINLGSVSDPIIDDYTTTYNNYTNNLDKLKNVNNTLSLTPTSNDITYKNNVEKENNNLSNEFLHSVDMKNFQMTANAIDNLGGPMETFKNEIENSNYDNYIKLFVLIIIFVLILFGTYMFLRKIKK
jgi:hypothetical protein